MMYACSFKPPFQHGIPTVHATGLQISMPEWPAECVWWALKSERHDADRLGDGYYNGQFLQNLEKEWERRGLCSRCLRDIDQPLAEQVAELKARAESAEDKLGRIRRTAMERPDITLRPEVMRILDEP
jgi:hypothetical protein